VPSLGELLKRHVTKAIFLLLCISFMRVDLALCDYLRSARHRDGGHGLDHDCRTLIAGRSSHAVGVDQHAPDLFLALMLRSIASPMMASPSLAPLMGLDATLVL